MKRFFAPGSDLLVKRRSSVMPSSWICVRQPWRKTSDCGARAHQMCRGRGIAQRPGSGFEEHVAAGDLYALAAEPAANVAPGLVDGDFGVGELAAREEGAREASDAPAEHRDALRMRRRG